MVEQMKLKALVVDDNPWWLGMLNRMTSEAGYDVFLAQTYDQALKMAKEIDPSLVVTDVRLQDSDESNTDGLRLLRTLCKDGQLKASIVVTGYPTPEQKEIAESLGAPYLEKGNFSRKDFQRELANLGQKSPHIQVACSELLEAHKLLGSNLDHIKNLIKASAVHRAASMACL